MRVVKLGRNWWKDDPLTKQRTRSEKLFIPLLILGFVVVITAAVLLATQTIDPPVSPIGQNGPPTLDQILYFGLSTNPGTMTAWSAIGSVSVGLITAKILSDTVKYFDYYGMTSRPRVSAFIGFGTVLIFAHVLLTCAQTWTLCHHAFTDYHTILRFDILCSTYQDMIAGFFGISAVLYYTAQVFRLSGKKIWLAVILLGINTGVLILTFIIAVTGFRTPQPTQATLDKFIKFNEFRKPIFMAWGIVGLVGDSAICFSLLFYLFKSKDSVLHRGQTMYHKLKALVVETMFPPVICVFILVITTEKKAVVIGDYRRAIRVLLTPLYYLSVLHSIVARIDIRRHLAETQDHDTNKDSIPLTATEPGEMSTIHIDPKRGQDVVIIEARSRGRLSQIEEIPCKRTFGNTESISNPETNDRRLVFADQDRVKTLPRPSRFDTANFTKIEDLPQKGTFGTGEPLNDLVPILKPSKTLKSSTSPERDRPSSHPVPSHALLERGRNDRHGDGGEVEGAGPGIPTWANTHYFGPSPPRSPGSDSQK